MRASESVRKGGLGRDPRVDRRHDHADRRAAEGVGQVCSDAARRPVSYVLLGGYVDEPRLEGDGDSLLYRSDCRFGFLVKNWSKKHIPDVSDVSDVSGVTNVTEVTKVTSCDSHRDTVYQIW